MTLPVDVQARMGEIRTEVEAAGAELVELLFRKADQRSILTFLVDKTGGITLDDCALLNQKLGALFDRLAETGAGESGFFQGRYLLEVSSPGLDRPLKTPRDFERVLGQAVRVHCHNGASSHAPVTGKLSSVSETGIELEMKDGSRRAVSYADIAKAVREIGWKH